MTEDELSDRLKKAAEIYRQRCNDLFFEIIEQLGIKTGLAEDELIERFENYVD